MIDSLQCGGAERHAVDLAGALVTRGGQVTIACSTAGHFAADAERAGARVAGMGDQLVKRRFSPRFAAHVRSILSAEEFDLVHGHLYAGGLAAVAATAGSGVPVVLTEQTEAPWRSPRHRLASRLAYRRARRVIGVSCAITEELETRFGVPSHKVRCVPNGVAIAGPAARADRAGSPPVVGLVARLQPEKDVPTFLRAAAQLARRFPDVRFRIAGDGPLRGELAQLAERLGVASRVEFLGVVRDMPAFFREIDVLACSSVAEGTPLAIAEAMGSAIPVVATRIGGIPDQIRDGEDGLLVPPGDPALLAARVAWLLEDESVALRIGKAGFRRAERDFSTEAMASSTLAVYEETVPVGVRVRAGRPGIERSPSARHA